MSYSLGSPLGVAFGRTIAASASIIGQTHMRHFAFSSIAVTDRDVCSAKLLEDQFNAAIPGAAIVAGIAGNRREQAGPVAFQARGVDPISRDENRPPRRQPAPAITAY